MADGLRRLLTSAAQRTALVSRGREVLARYTPQHYRRTLRRALDETKVRLREARGAGSRVAALDRKSTRLNSSHSQISYAVFCLKKKKHLAQHQRSARV